MATLVQGREPGRKNHDKEPRAGFEPTTTRPFVYMPSALADRASIPHLSLLANYNTKPFMPNPCVL